MESIHDAAQKMHPDRSGSRGINYPVGSRPANPKKARATQKAICVLSTTNDSKVSGIVLFTVKGDAVEITGDIMGLTPGKHGFHVHDLGDISSSDGMTTGGHFNPDKEKRTRGPHSAERHVGDLGNIDADAGSKAHPSK